MQNKILEQNNYEFINDEDVIGKWVCIDEVNSIEEFDIANIEHKDNESFKEIYFMEGGKPYWIFEGWTKGILCTNSGGDSPDFYNKYIIKTISGKKYIFLYLTEDRERIVVLEKVSDKSFEIDDFKKKENIDYEFVNDEEVVGKWKSIAVIDKIEDFDLKYSNPESLWLEEINFIDNGSVIRKYYNNTFFYDTWTKGCLIDKKKHVVSKYFIKEIEDEHYMFIEWKMGNYVYGGYPPSYYVLKKVDIE